MCGTFFPLPNAIGRQMGDVGTVQDPAVRLLVRRPRSEMRSPTTLDPGAAMEREGGDLSLHRAPFLIREFHGLRGDGNRVSDHEKLGERSSRSELFDQLLDKQKGHGIRSRSMLVLWHRFALERGISAPFSASSTAINYGFLRTSAVQGQRATPGYR